MASTIVVGNPRLGSRTRWAAELVTERLTGKPATSVVEVAHLGPALVGVGTDGHLVDEAKRVVLEAELLVVASPVYKATYTGLLKLFLDQFGASEVPGTPTIPLMVGGQPNHALAGELTLKPVLSEIGCSCPTPALFLLESDWDSAEALEPWLTRAKSVLRRRS